MKAAIYARYSTDKQTHDSVEGQYRLCREHATRLGFRVVAEYCDDAVSGAVPILQRPGGRRLMAEALDGRFDVLVIEGLDRLSRDLVDGERMVRRLEHAGRVRILGVSDGYDSLQKGGGLLRKVRGALNEEYRADVAAKVHRGLANKLASGFHAGGLSYGYRSIVAGHDARGEPIGHLLEVNEEHAPWVRWIFDRYAAGSSPAGIAGELNRMAIPGPRRHWAQNAIYGRADRGVGVLNNEIYLGRLIWNRSKWLKDPDSGKRIRVDRPREEWHVEERAHLRIVSDDLWQAVRARQGASRYHGGSRGKGAAPRTLFGGLLSCGHCGGPMIAISKSAYGCKARKEQGDAICRGMYAPRLAVDTRLLSMVRDEITSPEAIEVVRREFRKVAAQERTPAPVARIAELDRQMGRLVESIASMGGSKALEERLAAVEAERTRLAAEAADAPVAPSLKAVEAEYKALVLRLREALQNDVLAARPLLREVLGPVSIETVGKEVYALVGTPADRLMVAGALGVVAGTRFGTRRLKIR